MTGADIITKFELYIDDTTELSSVEELGVLNKRYRYVLNDRPWEFLKKEGTGTTSSSVPYVSLPADFAYLTPNQNYSTSDYPAQTPVVFVGTTYKPYRVVSWSDRRQYNNNDGYCYIDIVNNRLVFTKQPQNAEAITFDYIYNPEDITLATSPVFPSRFHDMLFHGMCVDDFIIQQSDKAKSYAGENLASHDAILAQMGYWNSQLIVQ